MKHLRPTIERVGQRYFDEPIYERIEAKPLALCINHAFRRTRVHRVSPAINALIGHNRVHLRWVERPAP